MPCRLTGGLPVGAEGYWEANERLKKGWIRCVAGRFYRLKSCWRQTKPLQMCLHYYPKRQSGDGMERLGTSQDRMPRRIRSRIRSVDFDWWKTFDCVWGFVSDFVLQTRSSRFSTHGTDSDAPNVLRSLQVELDRPELVSDHRKRKSGRQNGARWAAGNR